MCFATIPNTKNRMSGNEVSPITGQVEAEGYHQHGCTGEPSAFAVCWACCGHAGHTAYRPYCGGGVAVGDGGWCGLAGVAIGAPPVLTVLYILRLDCRIHATHNNKQGFVACARHLHRTHEFSNSKRVRADGSMVHPGHGQTPETA